MIRPTLMKEKYVVVPDDVTVAQAIALLPDDKDVHTFIGAGSILMGCSVPRAELVRRFKKTPPEKSGPNMESVGHGLALCEKGKPPLFIEVRKEVKR